MAQPKPPLSTSQIGIDADGAMWLATPSGMEPAGGGDPFGGVTHLDAPWVTTPMTGAGVYASLVLPAGLWLVWVRLDLSVTLSGQMELWVHGGPYLDIYAVMAMGGSYSPVPQEITGPTTVELHPNGVTANPAQVRIQAVRIG